MEEEGPGDNYQLEAGVFPVSICSYSSKYFRNRIYMITAPERRIIMSWNELDLELELSNGRP